MTIIDGNDDNLFHVLFFFLWWKKKILLSQAITTLILSHTPFLNSLGSRWGLLLVIFPCDLNVIFPSIILSIVTFPSIILLFPCINFVILKFPSISCYSWHSRVTSFKSWPLSPCAVHFSTIVMRFPSIIFLFVTFPSIILKFPSITLLFEIFPSITLLFWYSRASFF